MSYSYKHPRPSVTVDLLVFNSLKQLLLIRRAKEPYENCWALPGGFVDENENLSVAARRELLEETTLVAGELKQQGAYGEPGRDPRGHTISIVYSGLVLNENELKAADDAKEAQWFGLDQLPQLAFDHEKIINDFVTRF